MKGTLAFQVTKYVPMILEMLSNSTIARKGQLRVKVGRGSGMFATSSQILLSFKGKKRIIEPCPICKAEFKGKYVLAKHISRVHEKKRPYLCTVCGKSQVSTYLLNVHIK